MKHSQRHPASIVVEWGGLFTSRRFLPIAGARRKLLDSNGVAGFLGFDQISKLAQQFEAPNEVQNILAALDTVLFTGSMKKGKQAYEFSLNFKDKRTNGLQQLLELVAKNNPAILNPRRPINKPREADIGFDIPLREQR